MSAELRRLGLEVSLEKIQIPRWTRGEERAELVSYPGQTGAITQRIAITSLVAPGVETPSDGISADVVVVASLADLEARPQDSVAGRIVLVNSRFDERKAQSGHALAAYEELAGVRSQARPAASRQGAAAVLIRSIGGADYRLPHTGITGFDPKVRNIPAGAVSSEDADLIARLAAHGPVRARVVLRPTLQTGVTSYNVIGDLKGTDHPEQTVIVSGHLDSWDLGTGAIDDGAGVAVALETAALLQRLKLRPKRTVRVVAWMAEELGVSGGFQYAREHTADVSQHFAAIESDLGAGHPIGIEVAGDPSIPSTLRPVGEILAASGAGTIEIGSHSGTDVYALNVLGVPAFQPIQDLRTYFDYQHTAADTLDKVNPQELRETAAVVSVLTYALATMNLELPRKPLPVPDWMK